MVRSRSTPPGRAGAESRSLAASTSARRAPPKKSKTPTAKAKGRGKGASAPVAPRPSSPTRVLSPFCMEDSSQEDDDIEDEDAPSMEESVPVSAHTSPPLRVSGRTSEQRPVSKKKPGIIYLSSIPPGFNVTRTTEFFSAMGKIGRVFLQPDKNERHHAKDHVALRFTEGWIEFMSKRVAKDVAENVNCTPVGGKKRSQSHEVLWNIKYLPRFKWSHLTERLNYEKATHHQKMRTEIARAKKESDFFKRKVEMSTKRKYSKRPKLAASNDDNFLPYET